MDELSCEIYQCVNINNISIPKRTFALFKNNILDKIKPLYTPDSFKSIKKSVDDAYKVKCNYKYIDELYESATNLINNLESVKNDTIDMDLFNILLNEFQYEYKKYLNPLYKTIINKISGISQLIQHFKTNKECDIKKKIIIELQNMCSDSGLTLLLFITSKMNYFIGCDMYDDVWKIIYKIHESNLVGSIYCLIVNLKILFLENIVDLETKMKIYYGIDIEKLRSDLRCRDFDSHLIESINLFTSVSDKKINKINNYDSQTILGTVKNLFRSFSHGPN